MLQKTRFRKTTTNSVTELRQASFSREKPIRLDGMETANQDLYNAIQGTYNLPEGTQGYTYDIDGRNHPSYVFTKSHPTRVLNAAVAPAAEKAGETSDLYKAYFNAPEGSSV